jgi:hypothetical protein
MTQDKYEIEQEYYETEVDMTDDFEPVVPMPEQPFVDDDYPYQDYDPCEESDQ